NEIQTRRHIANASTLLLAMIIVFLTLTPVTAPNIIGSASDKLYHVIAFAALTFPMALLYPPRARTVLICAILLGGAIEIIQPMVGRTASLLDFVADLIGALLGTFAGRIFGRLLLRRQASYP
ncbi:MAG: VanZ family protein, partial [Anaerolineales bacterium]